VKKLTLLFLVCSIWAIYLSTMPTLVAKQSTEDASARTSFREKMKNMENRYNSLGRRLDSLIIRNNNHIPKQTVVPAESYRTDADKIVLDQNKENQNPSIYSKRIEQSWSPVHTISLSYGVCIPYDVDVSFYKLEHDFGHQLQIAYYRNFQKLFMGFKFDTKFYQTHQLVAPGLLPIEVSGDNFLAQGSVMIGNDYFLNDHIFIRNIFSLGLSYADNNWIMGSERIQNNESSTQIIGGLQTSLGIQLHENFSALFYYQLDAIPSRKSWGSQFFSHFGISGNIKY
jgi:hypothetical protein